MTAEFVDQLALLCELQQIDLNLHTYKRTLENLPNEVRDLSAAFFGVKDELARARAELGEVEKSKRTDESDLAASVEHLREREAKLYAIKTNKEYQAALKEISEGKRLNREREDRVLAAMEKIEELTKKIAQLEKDHADKESAYEAKRKELGCREEEIRAKMEEDQRKRPEVAGRIDKVIMRKYEFVHRRYANAVVGVVGGICHGCSTRIPPQLYNEMLRREGLKVCPSCQRLIYFSEAKKTEGEGKTDPAYGGGA